MSRQNKLQELLDAKTYGRSRIRQLEVSFESSIKTIIFIVFECLIFVFFDPPNMFVKIIRMNKYVTRNKSLMKLRKKNKLMERMMIWKTLLIIKLIKKTGAPKKLGTTDIKTRKRS